MKITFPVKKKSTSLKIMKQRFVKSVFKISLAENEYNLFHFYYGINWDHKISLMGFAQRYKFVQKLNENIFLSWLEITKNNIILYFENYSIK